MDTQNVIVDWFNAVKSNNTEVVSEMMSKKLVDANVTDDNKDTALFIAAREGFIDIIKILYSDEEFIPTLDSLERTPMMIAALHGHKEIVDLFYGFGANTDSIEGKTVIHYAIENNSEKGNNILRRLAPEFGINLNVRDKIEGNTPIIMALKNKNYEAVEILLNPNNIEDTNTNMQDNDGKYPLLVAYENQNFDIFKKILEYKNTNPNVTRKGESILFKAVNDEEEEYVDALVMNEKN